MWPRNGTTKCMSSFFDNTVFQMKVMACFIYETMERFYTKISTNQILL